MTPDEIEERMAEIEKGQLLGGHCPNAESLGRARRVLRGEITRSLSARFRMIGREHESSARRTPYLFLKSTDGSTARIAANAESAKFLAKDPEPLSKTILPLVPLSVSFSLNHSLDCIPVGP